VFLHQLSKGRIPKLDMDRHWSRPAIPVWGQGPTAWAAANTSLRKRLQSTLYYMHALGEKPVGWEELPDPVD